MAPEELERQMRTDPEIPEYRGSGNCFQEGAYRQKEKDLFSHATLQSGALAVLAQQVLATHPNDSEQVRIDIKCSLVYTVRERRVQALG